MRSDESGVRSQEANIPDQSARSLAETTFDRNVVVVAGAGTGKTTLLVNRLVHLLMREPKPIEITRIVALTFTNKAATELKVRLRERLQALREIVLGQAAIEPGAVSGEDLRKRYGLSSDEIDKRAKGALENLEKAQIGTLHSFAAHVLRLHPLESGVDPAFETDDDGLRFDEHFSAEWEVWLDGELGPSGPNHALWRRLLAEVGLAQIREVAYELRSELIPLDELCSQAGAAALSSAVRDWVMAKRTRVATLLTSHDRPKRRKIESMLAVAQELFTLLLERGHDAIGALDRARRQELDRDPGDQPAGWDKDEFADAVSLIRVAKQILTVDGDLIQDLLKLLTPFAQRVRAAFLEQGWISFDGLLARARTLLRDHPAVRERLKHEYLAVLVDEFQDTDPVQYEIILYLAERGGRCGATWRDVELDPGKLFIVGDPKQSIYAFRRADIEAFEQVVRKVRESGGVVYELATNFRSHGRLLEVVNPIFDRLLRKQENVQPPNVPLIVRPDRRGGVTRPGVELRLVTAGDGEEEFDAATATRIEADHLACWLKEDLLGRETLTDASGQTTPLRPGHVALLFRKLTQAQDYLEALRRHDIHYVTDGEKHFYRRQEVVDLINLLRVVENPHDMIALVGVLRSPLGGVADRELVELKERGALDYRRADRLADWVSPRAEPVRRLYSRLAEVARAAPRCPLPDAMDLLFAQLPVLELAAASLHGEQAMANLLKVRQMAADLAGRPTLMLTGFVELMIARLAEQPEEAESALAEESLEAVRVLTIHKAKGLEFPVVILPGFHHGTNKGTEAPLVSQDWSSGVFGVALGDRCSLGAVLVGEKFRAREEAERRRVFYVGMTRAKERLVLSGGLPSRPSRGTFLSLLEEVADSAVGKLDRETIRIGEASFEQAVVTATDRVPRRKQPPPATLAPAADETALRRRWDQREHAWAVASATPRELTPTGLMKREPTPARSSRLSNEEPGQARLIGTLAHRVLEHWDYTDDPAKLAERVAAVCQSGNPPYPATEAAAVEAELRDMFAAFAASGPYAELRRATILGREIPFAIPWTQSETGHPSLVLRPAQDHESRRGVTRHCVMEGMIDVVYRLDGQVWIADYKTDRVRDEDIPDRLAQYGLQARIYTEAVSQCLGVDRVGFKFIFLRQGIAAQA